MKTIDKNELMPEMQEMEDVYILFRTMSAKLQFVSSSTEKEFSALRFKMKRFMRRLEDLISYWREQGKDYTSSLDKETVINVEKSIDKYNELIEKYEEEK